MAESCCNKQNEKKSDPATASTTGSCCSQAGLASGGAAATKAVDPLNWFNQMLDHCYQHAVKEKAAGKRIVGILCEFTPRELIMAAGGVPVCLCGGSAKTIPAAEELLPANLCPLIKSTFGYHVLKNNPFLEMVDLIVGETTCDGKKKMYELMGDTRTVYVLELPQKADDPDAMQHWCAELKKFRAFLEDRFGTSITDCQLRQAIAVMNRERALRRELAALAQADPPPLTGRQLLDFRSSISCIPEDLAQYEKAIELYRSGEAGDDGEEPVRVLMTGVPIVRGAERVLEIIENDGVRVVAMENCTGLKPILEDVDAAAPDPLRALAEKYFHLPCSVMTPNQRRLDTLRTLIQEYRAECVVELIWQACLTYDVESHKVRHLVEEELGLPYLRIETDYSPSDSARIVVRVEALIETVRGKRPAKKCQIT
jgi:benzoyl-CoA reductase/2-hydroxyglutaryl-CoA dehydratase subunit BcrC/BadD/HgdB